jgi:thymidylate synthase
VETLKRDLSSRQAVATVWTPAPGASLDVPCTVAAQFLVRDGKLSAIWTMRSSDIWLGLPYDLYSFSQLTNLLAALLNLDTGYIQMQLGSSHLYEYDWEKAGQVLADKTSYQIIRSPKLPGAVPAYMVQVLAQPDDVQVIDAEEPWRMYANVLQSKSWTEARTTLEGGNE